MVTALENTNQKREWGEAIRRARQAKGLSQEDVAAAWDDGSLSYLQKIERGMKGTEETFNELTRLIRSMKKHQRSA